MISLPGRVFPRVELWRRHFSLDSEGFCQTNHRSTSPPYPTPAVLEVENACVVLGGIAVVDQVSFSVNQGSMYAIIGPNGAGKSTLLKAVVGLQPCSTTGKGICVKGVPHILARDSWRHGLGFVPQRADIDWNFPITVQEVAAMGVYPGISWKKRLPSRKRQRINETLALLGMDALSDRRIGDLSGGQQQKTFLARVMVQNPDIILLDEPFNGIDATSTSTIIAALKHYCQQGGTVVCVHHDLHMVRQHFDAGLLMNRQAVCCGDIHHVTAPAALGVAYTAPCHTSSLP